MNYGSSSKLREPSNLVPENITFLDDATISPLLKEGAFEKTESISEFPFTIETDSGNVTFYGEQVLTIGNISLKERLTSNSDKSAPPRLIFDGSFHAGTLDGCPDWNCEILHDFDKMNRADAILTIMQFRRTRDDQYIVFYSQESPMNSIGAQLAHGDFNMTLGYRHDSPVASPYAYTVKLAKRCRLTSSSLNISAINGKTLGAAWFVSNCYTESKREEYVEKLKKYYPVDIYGMCSERLCENGGLCEQMLDTHYHFYLSFENSICKDYITEKLWKHGYTHYVVPIVLKRSIVELYVPPHSFIAVDDFETIEDLAEYLHYLTNNRTAYLEYFKWRLNYRVVFLDGIHHNSLERPWGLCQLCRILWEEPRKQYIINNFTEYWFGSCDRSTETSTSNPFIFNSD